MLRARVGTPPPHTAHTWPGHDSIGGKVHLHYNLHSCWPINLFWANQVLLIAFYDVKPILDISRYIRNEANRRKYRFVINGENCKRKTKKEIFNSTKRAIVWKWVSIECTLIQRLL